MQQRIRLYGDEAEPIREGDIFEAHIRSVEGRKVVELKCKKRMPGPLRSDE